jgi:hypothetical protein
MTQTVSRQTQFSSARSGSVELGSISEEDLEKGEEIQL